MKGMPSILGGLLLLFFFSVKVSAFNPEIGRMRVSIWPEYDDSGVLVIYDGRFVDEGSFPLETTFLIPAGAVIGDACSLSPKGQHFCQLFTQKRSGDVEEVLLKLPYPNFYLSFRITPFEDGSPARRLVYKVNASHSVGRLEVDIQRPLRSEGFSLVPQSEEQEELKGFEHHRYVFKDVKAGALLPFEIGYRKEDKRPSVNIKFKPMLGGKVWEDEANSRINEIARELACPCECPLVLEDCNMSCGLDWKDQIGEMLRLGKSKQEIIDAFISKHGDACRITPVQRIHGKFYQYTRRFDTIDWIMLWSGVGLLLAGMFLAIYITVRRFMRKRDGELA